MVPDDVPGRLKLAVDVLLHALFGADVAHDYASYAERLARPPARVKQLPRWNARCGHNELPAELARSAVFVGLCRGIKRFGREPSGPAT